MFLLGGGGMGMRRGVCAGAVRRSMWAMAMAKKGFEAIWVCAGYAPNGPKIAWNEQEYLV